MKRLATKQDFKKAPLGHPFLEVCPYCTKETGNVLVKKRGKGKKTDALSLPRYLAGKNICEFCHFLLLYTNDKNADHEKGQALASAKLVDSEGSLIAYVPFDSNQSKVTVCGKEVKMRHTMVLGCEKDEEGTQIKEIVEEGIECFLTFDVKK